MWRRGPLWTRGLMKSRRSQKNITVAHTHKHSEYKCFAFSHSLLELFNTQVGLVWRPCTEYVQTRGQNICKWFYWGRGPVTWHEDIICNICPLKTTRLSYIFCWVLYNKHFSKMFPTMFRHRATPNFIQANVAFHPASAAITCRETPDIMRIEVK